MTQMFTLANIHSSVIKFDGRQTMHYRGTVIGLLSLFLLSGCGSAFTRGSTLYDRISDPLTENVPTTSSVTATVAFTKTTTAATIVLKDTLTSSAAVVKMLEKLWGVTIGFREEFGLNGDHYRSFIVTYLMKERVLQLDIIVTRRKERVLSEPSNKDFKVSIADISLGTRDETRRYIATPVLSFLVVECSATWPEAWFLTIDGALYLGSGYSFNVDWRETDVMTDMDPATNDSFSLPTKLASKDTVTGHATLIGNIGLPQLVQLQIVVGFVAAVHDSRLSLGAGIKW